MKTGPLPFGLKISIISRAFRKKMDEKACAMGLTAVQLRVLGAVSLLEESGETDIHQNDLEKIERVTHPAMTRVIQKLESKGFITCVTAPMDRRYKKISCTEQSRRIHNTFAEQDEEVLAELCRGFTDEQKKTLFTLTDMLVRNISR